MIDDNENKNKESNMTTVQLPKEFSDAYVGENSEIV